MTRKWQKRYFVLSNGEMNYFVDAKVLLSLISQALSFHSIMIFICVCGCDSQSTAIKGCIPLGKSRLVVETDTKLFYIYTEFDPATKKGFFLPAFALFLFFITELG